MIRWIFLCCRFHTNLPGYYYYYYYYTTRLINIQMIVLCNIDLQDYFIRDRATSSILLFSAALLWSSDVEG